MIKIITTLLVLNFGQTCFGQTVFLKNLKNTTWVSETNLASKPLNKFKQISLLKSTISKDNIHKNVTFWVFNDSIISISNYNHLEKKDSIIGNYKYSILTTPSRIEVKLDNDLILQYEVGVNSTGDFATLFKTKNIYTELTAIFDINSATKDGYYINEYVVEIPIEKAKKINGKKIQINGAVSIVKEFKMIKKVSFNKEEIKTPNTFLNLK